MKYLHYETRLDEMMDFFRIYSKVEVEYNQEEF